MTDNNLIHEEKDGIVTLTFNRPKALNALNASLLGAFSKALDGIAAAEDLRVLVLTGAGDKAFVAGADISELATFNALQARKFAKLGHEVIGKLQQLPIPVIAAVNGYALGGGSEIALACDFIYASDAARFGLPEITLGLVPGFGGTQRLPRLVGSNRAKEMIFTGKMITAAEAEAFGMVNRVFSADTLMDETLKTAGTMVAMGKVSIRAAKMTINNGLNVDLASGCAMEIDAFALCMAGPDGREGTTAFLEKRKAVFKGDLNQ